MDWGIWRERGNEETWKRQILETDRSCWTLWVQQLQSVSTLVLLILPIYQGLLHTLPAAHLQPDTLQHPLAFLCLAEHTPPSVAFVLDKEWFRWTDFHLASAQGHQGQRGRSSSSQHIQAETLSTSTHMLRSQLCWLHIRKAYPQRILLISTQHNFIKFLNV